MANKEIYGSDIATAKILLDIKAVNFRPEQPYIFTSGWASPVYIDCRKLISFPAERRHVIQQAASLIGAEVGWSEIDAVAGGETAGIPYAAWIAEVADKPMLYVRKKAKGFGRNAQIEGDFADGARVILIEDLATDGASKVLFVNALRDAGTKVSDSFVVFFYGIFPGALSGLADLDLRLHFLATWWDVLKVAEEGDYFPRTTLAEVRRFLDDPIAWSKAHGGKGAI